ncbi:Hypothetical protein PHPALM_15077 [Phytophthora palmivora]|uniref:START domain-containing protein n=1 Tax=Phytophthora palmivora TaxID=4796 RepID=A0A2P4XT88_9STRA|nr:Hypothetical protein PHPALM_15077 [Phytophthora palmivora]
MVKCTRAASVVPDRVHISATKHQELTDMADGIIAETLHTYEFFVANDRQLPSDQWKHVKSREKVRVYRSRRGKMHKLHSQSHDEKDPSRPRLMSAGAMEQHQRQAAAYGRPYAYDDPIPDEEISTTTNSSSSDAGSFSLFEDSVLAKVKPSHVPLIVATGQIEGTVEDVAYGGLANTKHAWLVRNSYVHNDHFDDRKVLAVLQSPSEEDPFRSVTIKWGTAEYGAFTTRRDFTYLESQGMAFDSDGERIFYYLNHTIELDDCPRLDLSHNIIRVQMSMAYIVRQLNNDTVEMFGRGFADPRGEMMESYGVMLLANNVTSSARVVECSNMKKLSYLMTQRRRSDASGIIQSSDCGVKCSVQKKLTIEASTEITQKNFTFCLSCVIEAKELSAWEVASAYTVLPKRLHLTPEQEHALTDLADRIVAETLQENEDFIANDRRVDGRIWKKVKSRENVHVYRTRRSGSKHRGSSDVNEKDPSRPRLLSNNAVEQHQRDAIAAGRPLGFVNEDDEDTHADEASRTNTHSSTSEGGSFAIEDSVLAKTKPSYIPLIEASGVMDGTIEDAAFGGLANTMYAWEVRNSYTKNDGFDGRKILASLQGPSDEDPFRFVGVKWATRDYGAFMTRRDLLFLESSGMAFDSDGERVYYSLAHSIELKEVPQLDRLNIIRMNLSSCYIMRELSDDKIDVYCRGYSDMGGEMPEGFSVSFFSAAVAAISGMVECSYLKKLSWYMT